MAIELCLTPTDRTSSQYWGIVLAGGEGKRLKHFVKSTFGKECPKQYCAIIGSRSMLRHTIDRTRLLVDDEQLLTVICRDHLDYAQNDIHDRDKKTVFVIPSNRDTAPSILLPLLFIHKKDPNATVAIFPSDHFILEEDLFMDHVNVALEFVKITKEYIVTLGITPLTADKGYGWIKKGGILHQAEKMSFYSIQKFWEKPDDKQVRKIFQQGCLLNTMILVGKVQLFLNLFKEYTPDLYIEGLRVKLSLGKTEETKVIQKAFDSIPSINFSQTILQHIRDRICVLPMNNIHWSDWGEEERIRKDISQILRYKKSETVSASTKQTLSEQTHSIEYFSSQITR